MFDFIPEILITPLFAIFLLMHIAVVMVYAYAVYKKWGKHYGAEAQKSINFFGLQILFVTGFSIAFVLMSDRVITDRLAIYIFVVTFLLWDLRKRITDYKEKRF